jgi:hypothetical protein
MEYFYDEQRHLVCKPYSVENLHRMAADLGIKRCWYHAGDKPHYDVPKRMMKTIGERATLVSAKEILRIIVQ